MKSRMILSPLWKIGSWKNLLLCGKKSLKKPAVELPHAIIEESETVPRLLATLELLPEIIESEILTRLPAKSLRRFMCVCKQWKSLILTPEFARKNVQHLTNSQSLTHHKLLDHKYFFSLKSIDCEDLYNPSVAPLSVPYLNGALPIASLDGLVFVELPDTSEFAFWNPLTGAYKKFKANYPRSHTLVDAFYFDSSNNDYKVLQVTSHSGLNAYIYSQRFNSWKKIQFLENNQFYSNLRWSNPTFLGQRIYFMVSDFNNTVLIVFDLKTENFREIRLPIFSPNSFWSTPTCFGESLYFMGRRRRIRMDNGRYQWIIVFDVKSERFREIRFPLVNQNKEDFTMGLTVIKGCIHLFVANGCSSEETTEEWEYEFWRMDGDGTSWSKVAYCSPAQRHYENLDMEDFERILKVQLYQYTKWFHPIKISYVETLVSPAA